MLETLTGVVPAVAVIVSSAVVVVLVAIKVVIQTLGLVVQAMEKLFRKIELMLSAMFSLAKKFRELRGLRRVDRGAGQEARLRRAQGQALPEV